MSEGATATAAKQAAPDPILGRVIAERFKIVSLIARGGMGKVYRAEQAPLGRVCAVKILNPNYAGDADPEFHRRFFREASITSRITHPNSVTIFDYGKTDDEIYYMAMEYLEGQTLHQALRDAGTMPEDRVGRIFQQICRALREAHALKVIHRDLKPANVFLTRHGDDDDFVKVLDFGLVKHLSEKPEEQLTQTGLFMGSPKYMAPEQIQGGHVDERTDIYSLGIMMYEMLAGKVPFDRPSSVNILMAHVGEPPPSMREVNKNLVCTAIFEDLVMRCIAKDPAQRFASMDEVLQALKRAHGVSLTGQLAAVQLTGPLPLPSRSSQSGSGSIPPQGYVSSMPVMPSAVMSSQHRPLAGAMPGASAIEGSGPVSRIPGLPQRRSRAWIAFGVLVAAALGGVLGMVTFRLTSASKGPVVVQPSKTAGTSSSVAAAPASAAPAPIVTTSAAPVSASAMVSTILVHVTSEPAGASVREDGVELCVTPCDASLKPDPSDEKKTHKLLVTKAGYRPETRTVKPSDGSLAVKLVRGPGGGRPPKGTVAPPQGGDTPVSPAAPPAPPSQPATPPPATPSGFKDQPY